MALLSLGINSRLPSRPAAAQRHRAATPRRRLITRRPATLCGMACTTPTTSSSAMMTSRQPTPGMASLSSSSSHGTRIHSSVIARFKEDTAPDGPHSTADYDFAIVGAGPSGLAVALGLKKCFPSARIQVFDKARELRPIGAAVTIPSNGQAALRSISPEACQALQSQALPLLGMQFRDYQNNITASNDFTEAVAKADLKDTPIITSWFGIQKTLLDVLGANHLQLNKTLTGLEQQQDDGLVTLSFQDHTSVTAHVVIGADGNMSATRSALFPDEGPPEFTGWSAMWHAEEGPSRRMFMRNFGDLITVTALAKWPEERLQELWRKTYYSDDGQVDEQKRTEGKIARLKEILSNGLPEKVTSLIINSDPSALIEHGLYWRDPEQPWVKGRVALIGDAAHVMPPYLGQGTSLAFEDAYFLVFKVADSLSKASSTRGVPVLDLLRHQTAATKTDKDTTEDDAVSTAFQAYQAQMQKRIGLLSRQTLVLEKTTFIKARENPGDVEELGGMELQEYVEKRAGPFLQLVAVEDETRVEAAGVTASV